MTKLTIVALAILVPLLLFAQDEKDTLQSSGPAIEKLKYQQQPGLALAASKIFFSDRRYSIS